MGINGMVKLREVYLPPYNITNGGYLELWKIVFQTGHRHNKRKNIKDYTWT